MLVHGNFLVHSNFGKQLQIFAKRRQWLPIDGKSGKTAPINPFGHPAYE
jgi:hypothetical protein